MEEINNIKGALHGLCNRSACLKPGANWFNHSTREHYCEECAKLLNEHNRKDAIEMFGHDLCTHVYSHMEQYHSETHLQPFMQEVKEYPYKNPYREFQTLHEPPKGLGRNPCKRHEYIKTTGTSEKDNGDGSHTITTIHWVCKRCGTHLK